MYSYKQRKKAVELYIKYGLVAAPVIRALGYPNRHTLQNWYREYLRRGALKKKFADGRPHPTSCYSDEDMKRAVDTYVISGRNLNRTIQKLGYPKEVKEGMLRINSHCFRFNQGSHPQDSGNDLLLHCDRYLHIESLSCGNKLQDVFHTFVDQS